MFGLQKKRAFCFCFCSYSHSSSSCPSYKVYSSSSSTFSSSYSSSSFSSSLGSSSSSAFSGATRLRVEAADAEPLGFYDFVPGSPEEQQSELLMQSSRVFDRSNGEGGSLRDKEKGDQRDEETGEVTRAVFGGTWAPVLTRDLRDTPWEKYQENWCLWLSWVPHWSEAGLEALEAFRGDAVVVVGDRGGWTGTPAFFRTLDQEWEEVWRCPVAVWPGVDDDLRILLRRRT